ncbi:PREDICTED: mitochondrial dynamics protein MID49 [Bison bison bison]|uniref:Mitochondrial dynamics protein MID49 n=1 Tax=Bison bison bison TaxID=43346 RepID=A0A6P3HQK5_BISBB|nr:PREDICTED: mitochondrial dynamics protein MID49 [Bison bison bison]
MAEFSQNRSKRRDGEVLGGAVDFLLANARLVLGVGGAAVLGIATLAVKRLIDRATSPRDEDDTKGDAPCLEDSWQDLSLLKATPRLQSRPPPAALSQPSSDLCAVCRSHPALWRLGRDRLAQVVLRLGEQEADWAEEALGEHFLQALELLLSSLERASLPSHFNRSVNLLDGLREEEIDDLGFALYHGLQAPEGLL